MLRAQAAAAATAAKLDDVFDAIPRELAIIQQRARALGPGFDAARAKAEALGQAIHRATAAGATMNDPRLLSLSRAYADAGREAEQAGRRGAAGAAVASRAWAGLKGMLMGVVATAGAVFSVAAIGGAVRSYAQYEGVLNTLRAVSGATGRTFDQLREKTLALGTSSGFSAKEAAEGMVELARAGMNAKQVTSAIGGTLALAAAGEISIARASEIASDTLNQFGMAADQAGRVADILAVGANVSSISVDQIAESMTYAGSVAKAYGQNIEDTATAIAVLGNAGIKGSVAGTSLAAFMNRLAAPEGKKAPALIKQLGIQVKDAHGAMRPLPDLIDQVRNATKNLGKVERGRILKEVFGEEALKGVVSLIETTPAKYKEASEAIHKSAGEAERLSKIINQGLGKAWARLINVLDVFSKRVLLSVSPAIEGMIRGAADSIESFGNWIDTTLKVMKASGELGNIMKGLRLAFTFVAPGLLILGLKALAGVILTSVVPAVWAAVRASAAWVIANGPLILITGLITMLILVVQDLITWLNGGEAALGDVFDTGYENGYAFMEWLESESQRLSDAIYNLGYAAAESVLATIEQLSAELAVKAEQWRSEFYNIGYNVAAFFMGIGAQVAALVAGVVTSGVALLSGFATAVQTAWAALPGVASSVFSGVYTAIATWIDAAKTKIGEVAQAVASAAAGIPGLGALAQNAANALRTAAANAPGVAPVATPGAAADQRAAGITNNAATQHVTASVTVNPPPGATNPAAYGQAAAGGATAGTRKALAKGARSLPRAVR